MTIPTQNRVLTYEEVDQLLNQIKDAIYVDEIFLGIMYHAGHDPFRASSSAIMNTFKKIVDTYKDSIPAIDSLVFHTRNGTDYFSRGLESILFRVGTSCILNPQPALTCDRFEWSDEGWQNVETKIISKLSRKLTTAQMNAVQEAGRMFRSEMASYTSKR